MKKIKAVIFDLDGTLLDTEKIYRKCWPQAMKAFGYEVTDEQVLSLRSLGRPFAPEYMKKMTGDPDFDYPAVRELRKKLVEECIAKEGIQLKPGCHELLEFLKQNGITRAIATATDPERTKRYLEKVGLYEYFDKVVSATMVKEGKPSPYVYEYAVNELGLSADECIAVEDAPNGVKSAYGAGCKVIMVPDATRPDAELSKMLYACCDSLLDIMDIIKNEPAYITETNDQRLKSQIEFLLEIDKEKNIFRQTHLSGHGRQENDSEHAWHMAIAAYLLREHSNEKIDIGKTMIMCLIHDIVEIDAGDTYAYDDEGLKTQKEREDAAKQRIFGMLPEDQQKELTELFDEFEKGETAEAKFAHAMDNFQPLILNNSNGGSDWRQHGVSKEKVMKRQGGTKPGSQYLYEYTEKIINENAGMGNLK